MSVVLAGNPQPIVNWQFNGKPVDGQKDTGKLHDQKLRQYKYEYKLEGLRSSDCGFKLTYKANGYETLTGSSKVDVLCKFIL